MIVQSLIVGAMMLQGAPAAEPLAPTPIALDTPWRDAPPRIAQRNAKLASSSSSARKNTS